MAEHQTRVYSQTSRIFDILIAVEWAGAIVAAVWISPPVRGRLAPAALLNAGRRSVSFLTLTRLTLTRPAAAIARCAVAIGRMAFDRDWRLFIPATMVIVADHAGAASTSPSRA